MLLNEIYNIWASSKEEIALRERSCCNCDCGLKYPNVTLDPPLCTGKYLY